MEYVLLVAGLVVLVIGAEALVRGASGAAAALGISPLIIGLTVVAFGTSAPEMVVSTVSAYQGSPEIAIGNVIGSNIFNVLFILGISSLVAPLVVSSQLIRLDVPVMIGVSALFAFFALDGSISGWEGAVLFAGIVMYTAYQIRISKNESDAVKLEFAKEFSGDAKNSIRTWVINLGLVAAGLGLLILGSRWLVDAAVTIASAFGVSKTVIGLTIVAAGTSLPEVATSVVATIKGERDIAVGNVIGSNIFNILAVLGLASLFAPGDLPVERAVIRFDIPVMLAVAIACFPIFFSGSEISRWEGLVFLGYYVAYTAYLIMISSGSERADDFSIAMQFVVLPLTALTLGIVTFREWRRRRALAR